MGKRAKKSGEEAQEKRRPAMQRPPASRWRSLGGFDYEAAVKRLRKAKSSVSVTEIRKCVASIDYKKRLPAIAAIMAFGCCICNTMLIAICGFVFCVVGPGFVGKDLEDFKKDCESTKEYIALKTGEIRELDWEWVKRNLGKLDPRSLKKVQARLETTTAPKKEESVGKDMEVDKEQDADARAVLETCTKVQLWKIRRDGLGLGGQNLAKPKTIDVIVEKLRDEVSGLLPVWKSNSTRCCPRDRVCST